MFLRMLNDDQKRALWVLAYHLVLSDHNVSEKEGKLMDELTNGLRTEILLTPQQLMEKPTLDVFDTRETRVAVFLEILTLAFGDNMFPDAESKMVAKLATELGFSNEEFEKMKAWCERNCALIDEATTLMNAD
ncbi:MAG: hypothetical protein HQ513_00220 [Rhodospirillales bacterium]|nr:hypothetical protein [Rhodospirillales bacterium]